MRAKCNDDSNIPVWYENKNTAVKYAQGTYYLLGGEEPADNVVNLTFTKADEIEYSITGETYYEEVPIGGKVVDKYWQAAENVGILPRKFHLLALGAGNYALEWREE